MNDTMIDESVNESLNNSIRRKPSTKKILPSLSIIKNLDADLQNPISPNPKKSFTIAPKKNLNLTIKVDEEENEDEPANQKSYSTRNKTTPNSGFAVKLPT